MIINKEELLEKLDFFIWEMKAWKIFIYPTDTIYGIWCDSINKESVNKIREIKNREEKSFSIIVPSMEWIKNKCSLEGKKIEKIKKYLPWPYTFILKNSEGTGTLGIRMPKHYFSDIVEKTWNPFITTSVNLTWEKPAIKLSEISKDILDKVDYVIVDDSSLIWKWSTIIDMTWEKEIIIRK